MSTPRRPSVRHAFKRLFKKEKKIDTSQKEEQRMDVPEETEPTTADPTSGTASEAGLTILEHRPQPVSPFLKLPAELREMIYRKCFQFPRVMIMGQHHRNPGRFVLGHRNPDRWVKAFYSYERPFTTGLLCVNRQIHEEAYPIFYQEKIFSIYDTADFFALLSAIGPNNSRQIQYLEFCMKGPEDRRATQLGQVLEAVEGLLRVKAVGIATRTYRENPRDMAAHVFNACSWSRGIFTRFEVLKVSRGSIELYCEPKLRELLPRSVLEDRRKMKKIRAWAVTQYREAFQRELRALMSGV